MTSRHLELERIGRQRGAREREALAQRCKQRHCAGVGGLRHAVQVRADRDEGRLPAKNFESGVQLYWQAGAVLGKACNIGNTDACRHAG